MRVFLLAGWTSWSRRDLIGSWLCVWPRRIRHRWRRRSHSQISQGMLRTESNISQHTHTGPNPHSHSSLGMLRMRVKHITAQSRRVKSTESKLTSYAQDRVKHITPQSHRIKIYPANMRCQTNVSLLLVVYRWPISASQHRVNVSYLL